MVIFLIFLVIWVILLIVLLLCDRYRILFFLIEFWMLMRMLLCFVEVRGFILIVWERWVNVVMLKFKDIFWIVDVLFILYLLLYRILLEVRMVRWVVFWVIWRYFIMFLKLFIRCSFLFLVFIYILLLLYLVMV